MTRGTEAARYAGVGTLCSKAAWFAKPVDQNLCPHRSI